MTFFIIFLLLVLCFSFVLVYGAPYLPTQKKQIEAGLELLDLKKGQVFYELGCGDGRVLRSAARRGYICVGYELNPVMFVVAFLITWRYRSRVTVVLGNFWNADLSRADGVFVFLLDRFMAQLDEKLAKAKKPIRLVSYAFEIPGKKPVKIKDGIFLYKY